MSYRSDADLLLGQIRGILLNREPLTIERCETPEFRTVQEEIDYLAQCFSECYDFLKDLSVGNLEGKIPDRHNYMAGSLKALHAGLRHLTWQANQVAEGDYHQKVDFLGAFSDSFNKMTKQLEEREKILERRAEALSESMELLAEVVDGMTEWLVVVEIETKKIIHSNQSACGEFYDYKTQKHTCRSVCPLYDKLQEYGESGNGRHWELSCSSGQKVVSVESYYVEWNGKSAYAHLILDITEARIQEKELQYRVFHDELTGLGNRRYGLNKLEKIIKEGSDFSVVVIDLDRLKYVNDNFGHITGDHYIKSIADTLLGGIRSSDTVFRIGGDEFVLIFEYCNFEQTKRKMDGLYESIKAQHEKYPKSISYGIAYVEEHSQKSVMAILEEADQRMYDFKNEHRESRFV